MTARKGIQMRKLLFAFRPLLVPSIGQAAFLFVGFWMVLVYFAPRAEAAPAATSTALAITSGGSAVTTVNSGSVVTLTATVTAGGAPVTVGHVNFCDATTSHCTDIHLLNTAQLTKAGTASFKFRPGIGSHSYNAFFAGTPNGTTKNASSASSSVALTVTGTIPTTTSIVASGSVGNYSLTATVTGSGGSASPTGIVSFLDTSNGNAVLGLGPLGLANSVFTFTDVNTPISLWPSGLVVAEDLNGDGILDLAVENNYFDTLTVLLGDGTGHFKASPTISSTGPDPSTVAVGDFNNDGIPDLAIANGDATLTILLGNGDGTFTPAAGLMTGISNGVTIGDFNRDGISDLAVSRYNTNEVTIYLGNGDGTFTAKSSFSPNATSIAVGDFNGDGVPDLAIANSGNNLIIMLGNGDGTFTAATTPPELGGHSYLVAVGDFNLDGNLDLAVANSTSEGANTVTILLGNGDGTFTTKSTLPTMMWDYSSVEVVDYNGDGIPDLAVSYGSVGEGVYTNILLGNGDGTFTATNTLVGTLGAVGDFNGDGIPDTALINVDDSVTILLTTVSETATATVNGVSVVGTGSHTVVAEYPGDSIYGASESSTTSLTATKITPTVAVTPSPSSITTAQALTVKTTVSGGTGNLTPTGSVTLTTGSYTSAAATLNTGSANINIPAGLLATGSDTLTVTYIPDSSSSSTYNSAMGSNSVTVTTAVSPSFTISGNAVSIAPGATTGNTSTITVTPAGGFTGTVNLSCAISPTAASDPATCSLSPASVAISGAAQTSTLTILTTAASNSALVQPKLPGKSWYAAAGATLACLLLFGLPARRRSWRTMLGMLALLIVLSGGVIACGGGGSAGGGGGGGGGNSGTTAGTYTITVTGTSGTITATSAITLTVQ